MSWSEVKKINSNFVNEPLNFNDYVLDIFVASKDSFILNPVNETMWKDLLLNSRQLYSSKNIHSTIYDRLTLEEVDYVYNNSTKLNDILNLFYGINSFIGTNTRTILAELTYSKLNSLESKFKAGFGRYISFSTSTGSIGEWLAETYNEPTLSSYSTLESIINDTELWTTGCISTNVALKIGLCSTILVKLYDTSTMPVETFNAFINIAALDADLSTLVWDELTVRSKLDDFWNNSTAAASIFDSVTSMVALSYHTAAFSTLCSNLNGITVLTEHLTNIEIFLGGWVNHTSTSTALSGVTTALTNLLTSIDNMPVGAYDLKGITESIAKVNESITSVNNVNSKVGNMLTNFSTFNTSLLVWEALMNNDYAISLLMNSTYLPNIIVNSVPLAAMVASTKAITAIINNDYAYMYCMETVAATAAIYNSETARTIFFGPTAEELVVNTGRLVLMQSSSRYVSMSGTESTSGAFYHNVYAALNYSGPIFAHSVGWSGTPSATRVYNATAETPTTYKFFRNLGSNANGYSSGYSTYTAYIGAVGYKVLLS